MELRISRTWREELACSISEVRFGGDNPMKRVSSDTLQYRESAFSDWKDVEIVEDEGK